MNFVTIRPINKLLENTKDRENISLGDIEQIENKINSTIQNKENNPKQKHSVYIDKKHLSVVKKLKQKLVKNKIISKKELIAEVDKILKKQNLFLESREHPVAYNNKFRPIINDNKNPKRRSYDLAFYNTLAAKSKVNYHHESDLGRDVYYIRCEVFDNNLLVGNMQIDTTYSDEWKNRNIGKIMSLKKNLYDSMVQEIIKHAIQKKYKKILFQKAMRLNIPSGANHSLRT